MSKYFKYKDTRHNVTSTVNNIKPLLHGTRRTNQEVDPVAQSNLTTSLIVAL